MSARLGGVLQHLSFSRAPRGWPVVPTNEERIRAYRAFAPAAHNEIDWPHAQRDRARRYELDAIADSAPDMTEE